MLLLKRKEQREFSCSKSTMETMCEIYSNLTTKTPERRQCCHDVVLVFLLLTLRGFHTLFSCVQY